MKPLILASQSPQRRLLLETLSLPFTVVPADIDEQAIQHEQPTLRAQHVAVAKAAKVAALHPQSVIVAADTFVVCRDRVLEKPSSLQAAQEMLAFQSGQWLEANTGWVFLDGTTGTQQVGTVIDRAQMRHLSAAEIAAYVQQNPVTTWSASFSPAFPPGVKLFNRLEGALSTFCYGLPIELLIPLLRQAGFVV